MKMTGNMLITVLLLVILGAGLALVTNFGPQRWDRLKHLGQWITVIGFISPPILFGLFTFRSSENPALWLFGTNAVALGAGLLGFVIGIFLPPSWPIWLNLSVGLIPWSVAIFLFVAKII